MSASVAIPIAGFKDVYDVPAVEKALQDLSPTANEALRAIYEKMVRLGGQRFTVKPSALPEMERLFAELPNFAAVVHGMTDLRIEEVRELGGLLITGTWMAISALAARKLR